MYRVFAVLVFLALAYVLYISYGYRYVLAEVRSSATPQMTMGSTSASTKIIVYSDYDSIASRQLYPVLLNLMASDLNVNVIIRPVAKDSRLSQLATRIALAAKTQNRFMDVHSILMSSGDYMDETYMRQAVESLGLDYDMLEEIALSGAVEEELSLYQREVLLLRISNLPYFYVGHVKMQGASYKVEDIRKIITDLRTGRR